MTSSLVGSEMCIRDRRNTQAFGPPSGGKGSGPAPRPAASAAGGYCAETVSYTHLTLPTICSV
eukprot:5569575-Prorocentrum_lima.AAC.1